jgi:hypothetical protein
MMDTATAIAVGSNADLAARGNVSLAESFISWMPLYWWTVRLDGCP